MSTLLRRSGATAIRAASPPRLLHASAKAGKFLVSEGDSALAAGPRQAAFLFGWVGAKDRALQRYAAAWLEAGCDQVYRHTAPTTDVFLRDKELEKTARETLELMQKDPETCFHLVYFSNGGCFIHEKLAALWKEDQKRPEEERKYKDVRLSSFTFDSCPAYLSLTAGSRALTGSIKNPVLRTCAFAITFCIFSIFIPLFWGRSRPAEYFRNLTQDPFTRTPSLYIYSDSDVITCPRELAKFIEERRKFMAAEEVLVEWRITKEEAKSGHVAHMMALPKAYQKRVSDFLRMARDKEARKGELR